MMSKKNLTRKILCGLLAAGVVGVAGNAMAAEYTGKITTGVYNDDVFNLTNNNVGYEMDVDRVSSPITINSRIININCSADTDRQIVGADAWIANKSVIGGKLILGNSATEKISIVVNNTYTGLTDKKQTLGLVSNGAGSDVEVTAKEFSIDVAGDRAIAINIGNNTQEPVAPANAAKMTINADKINIASSGTGVTVFSNGQLTMNGDLTVTVGDEPAFNVRGNSTTNINIDGNHKTVINGDIDFGTPNVQGGDGHNSGNLIDATLNINFNGEGSAWTGKAYQELGTGTSIEINTNRDYYGDAKGLNVTFTDGAAWNMTGDSFVNTAIVKDGGSINVQEDVKGFNAEKVDLDKGNLNIKGENTEGNEQNINITNLTNNSGTINMQGDEQKINVTNLSGTNGTVVTDSLTNSISAQNSTASGLTVQGTGAIADAIQQDAGNAQKLADVVSAGNGDDKKSVATEVKTEEGKVGGAYYAKVDENGKIDTQSVIHTENTTNRAISDLASISLMTWRAENNDMNKRLGELRDSKGEHGAWARMARGESKYGAQNVKNQYNYYQVGYDEKLSVNPNWTVGVALTRTEGTSSFTNGSGENKHTGFAVYGSYLNDNGSFIDLIAKYARMDNDYKTVTGAGSGDYETNGYSLSAEYGKRFTKDNGFWIEPQVELTYGRVGAADYVTANKVQVRQDEMNSIVGRLGFSLGKDIKQGNVYLRASYLYDFDGETEVKMLDSTTGARDSYKQDLGGGWWEVGVGTNINLSDATHLYFDVEKTYGGNVATPWQWNAGVRWSF